MAPSVRSFAAMLLPVTEISLGLLFIVSGILHTRDIYTFAVVITISRILHNPEVIRIVVISITMFEVFLGCLLLLGWHRLRPFTYGIALLFIMACSSAILYVRFSKLIRQVPCVATEMTSCRFCILLNSIMFVLFAAALLLTIKKPDLWTSSKRKSIEWGRSTLALFSLVAALGTSLYAGTLATSGGSSSPETDCKGSPFCGLHFYGTTTDYHLAEGTYFVAILSAQCGHCKKVVPDLNDIAASLYEDVPVVGLCKGKREDLRELKLETQPQFPIFPIDPVLFFGLFESKLPRLLLVRDGEIKHAWEWDVPDLAEILEKAFSEE